MTSFKGSHIFHVYEGGDEDVEHTLVATYSATYHAPNYSYSGGMPDEGGWEEHDDYEYELDGEPIGQLELARRFGPTSAKEIISKAIDNAEEV